MATCCSINMRIFKTTELILLLFFIVCSCIAAPAAIDSSANLNSNESNESNELEDHYDQRQNGTENYRIHIDGLVVVVAPVEALLLAGGLAGADDANILGIPGGNIDKPSQPEPHAEPRPEPEAELPQQKPKPEAELPQQKPKPEAELAEQKPKPQAKPEAEPEVIKEKHINAKSSNRPGVRLMSLLSPFLKRVHVQH